MDVPKVDSKEANTDGVMVQELGRMKALLKVDCSVLHLDEMMVDWKVALKDVMLDYH